MSVTRHFQHEFVGKIKLSQIDRGREIDNLLDYYKMNQGFLANLRSYDRKFSEMYKSIEDTIKSVLSDANVSLQRDMQKSIEILEKDVKNILFDLEDKVDTVQLAYYRRKKDPITLDDLDLNLQGLLGGSNALDINRTFTELRETDAEIKRHLGLDVNSSGRFHPAIEKYLEPNMSRSEMSIISVMNEIFIMVGYKTRRDLGFITDPVEPPPMDYGYIISRDIESKDDFGYITRPLDIIIDI